MQERQRFEENWKNAFEDAEVTPSDQLWGKLELDLLGDESKEMKKRVVFYQRLAAALVLVSASLGMYVWNSTESNQPESLYSEQPVTKQPLVADNTTSTSSDDPANSVVPNAAGEKLTGSTSSFRTKAQKPPLRGASDNSVSSTAIVFGSDASETRSVSTDSITEVSDTDTRESQLLAQVSANDPLPDNPPAVTEPLNTMTVEEATRLVEEYLKPVEEKSARRVKQKESLWLAMGGSAGSYNPTAQSSSASSTSFANSVVGVGAAMDAPGQTNRKDIGSAYSVGVSVGKKISERWVVQSGVNYMNQTIDYSSNVVAYSSANRAQLFVPEYYLNSDKSTQSNVDAVTTTNPYTINSAIEMISIPVLAGYLIIDRRIGWQVNGGFSSDLFIRNTLVDESGQVERFSQAAGKESPYRSVNWSGLMNTELSCRLNENYRLAVVPGLRYTLNSILKEGTSTPLVLDIGFRFRYTFN